MRAADPFKVSSYRLILTEKPEIGRGNSKHELVTVMVLAMMERGDTGSEPLSSTYVSKKRARVHFKEIPESVGPFVLTGRVWGTPPTTSPGGPRPPTTPGQRA